MASPPNPRKGLLPLLFAAMFALPVVVAAAPDERAADCRAATAREEPAPHDARERDPREAARDAPENRDETADCEAATWRARIPGMLR